MKRKTGRTFLIIGLILSFLFVVSIAVAQDKPTDNRQILMEKIKADKKLIVAQNMKLTEAEAKAFWPLYEKYQNELFLLRVRTLKLINDYAAVYDEMTNPIAKKLLNESMRIEELRLKLMKTYLPQFRKALPDTKVARYYQIENKINAALYDELAEKIPLIESK